MCIASHYDGLVGKVKGPFRDDLYYGRDCYVSPLRCVLRKTKNNIKKTGPSKKGRAGNHTGYQTGGYKVLNGSGGVPSGWYTPVNATEEDDPLEVEFSMDLEDAINPKWSVQRRLEGIGEGEYFFFVLGPQEKRVCWWPNELVPVESVRAS